MLVSNLSDGTCETKSIIIENELKLLMQKLDEYHMFTMSYCLYPSFPATPSNKHPVTCRMCTNCQTSHQRRLPWYASSTVLQYVVH